MAISFAQNTYSGEVKADLISHAVAGNDLVDQGLVKIKTGIQFKYVLPTIKLGDVIQDNLPTPTSGDSKGTYTIGERYLEPGDFMVYLEFNPRDFEEHWLPFQPDGNLVFRELDPMVQTKMLRLLIERKDEFMGNALWMSTRGGGLDGSVTPLTGPNAGIDLGDVTKNYKYWDGIVNRLLDSIKDDTAPEAVISAGTTTLDTGDKVEAALYAMWDKFPYHKRNSKDIKILMNWETFDLYDKYLSAQVQKYTENTEINNRRFKGKDIKVIVGMPSSTIIMGEFTSGDKSNLWMGVDYANDGEVIKVERKQANSELYFFQMRMKADINIVRPGEIVVHTDYTKP